MNYDSLIMKNFNLTAEDLRIKNIVLSVFFFYLYITLLKDSIFFITTTFMEAMNGIQPNG